MRDSFFVRINLPGGKDRPIPINRTHLEIFGINEDAVHYLNAAHETVCGIEGDEEYDLGHFERAKTMCLAYQTPSGTLAFNQCIRWALLLHSLGELQIINDQFGDDLVDRLEWTHTQIKFS